MNVSNSGQDKAKFLYSLLEKVIVASKAAVASLLGEATNGTIALYVIIIMVSLVLLVRKNIIPWKRAVLELFRKRIHLKRMVISLKDVPLIKRMIYQVEKYISFYPAGKLLALFPTTIFATGLGEFLLYSTSDMSFSDALRQSWTIVADSLNLTARVANASNAIAVFIRFQGMMVYTCVVGLISRVISEQIDSFQEQDSQVVESNHFLVLGWSFKLGSLLKQLSLVNSRYGGGVVVILAERDKVEMETDIAKFEVDFNGTTVICRTGSPYILADLNKVSVSKAHAIIVLACDGNAEESDARTMRVVLTLGGIKDELMGHAVVEIYDDNNKRFVKHIVETVVTCGVFNRLVIQCSFQRRLAQIWEEILGYEGVGFYAKRLPQLDGKLFKEVLPSFADAIPCGIKVAADSGRLVLNPQAGYVLQEGDEILFIANDDRNYEPTETGKIKYSVTKIRHTPGTYPKKILICGWSQHMDDMILMMDKLLDDRSELWLFNEVDLEERGRRLINVGIDLSTLMNVKVVQRVGITIIRRHLALLPLETFHSILILAQDSVDDSRALETLLIIQDIQAGRRTQHMPRVDDPIIVTEILDSATKNLIKSSVALSNLSSEFVVPNELVSMSLAMVAEDRHSSHILEELFAEEGYEICMRSVELYVRKSEDSRSLFHIMGRALVRQEIVIGFCDTLQTIINPPDKALLRKWDTVSSFVVISRKRN